MLGIEHFRDNVDNLNFRCKVAFSLFSFVGVAYVYSSSVKGLKLIIVCWSSREGINAIAEPGECRNVSSVALNFVAAFQTFIRASKLPVWNKTDNTGFWRMLTVSYSRTLVSIILLCLDKICGVHIRCSC